MSIAFIFSGQGAQYPGMMQDLYDTYSEAKAVFDIADSALGRKISDLCFQGTQEELNLTHNTQPCVLVADLAACAALMSHGIKPDVVAGFSLGEFAALSVAGVLPTEEIVRLVQLRADAMQSAVPVGRGSMAAIIGSTPETVQELCSKVSDGYVIPANYNCPGQTVISGETEAVAKAIEIAEENGLHAMKLAVSAPFHCKMMEPAALKLGEAMKTMNFADPIYPIFMNVDALAETFASAIPEKLIRQAMSPVLWEKTLRNMYDNGVDTFIELGPGRTLSGFVKKTLKGVNISHVEDIKSLHKTLEILGKK